PGVRRHHPLPLGHQHPLVHGRGARGRGRHRDPAQRQHQRAPMGPRHRDLRDDHRPGARGRVGLCARARSDPVSRTEVGVAAARVEAGAVEAVFLDLDGCVWFGSQLADGAAELVRDLRESGRTVAFLSNTSNSRASTVAAKLRRLGVPADEHDVLLPIELLPHHPLMRPRPPTGVVGTEEVRRAVAELTTVVDAPEAAELVVLARDPRLTYADLAAALQPLLSGAPLLALNLDARVPVDGGRLVPGTGALAAALEAASGRRAELGGEPSRFDVEAALGRCGGRLVPATGAVAAAREAASGRRAGRVGEPSRSHLAAALGRYGARPETPVRVGDTLDVDAAGGAAAGLLAVHVGGDGTSALDPA